MQNLLILSCVICHGEASNDSVGKFDIIDPCLRKESGWRKFAMNLSKAHLEVVVEYTEQVKEQKWPWPVAGSAGFIRLYGQTSEPEIGSFMATLLSYNRLEQSGTASDLLFRIIDSKRLILPGGLAVVAPNVKPIYPGCCCGLEGWREWTSALSSRSSPWLGHDPSPRVEFAEDRISVWSNCQRLGDSSFYTIDFTESEFREALHKVQLDLIAFLSLCKEWPEAIGFGASEQLVKRLDGAFSVRGA